MYYLAYSLWMYTAYEFDATVLRQLRVMVDVGFRRLPNEGEYETFQAYRLGKSRASNGPRSPIIAAIMKFWGHTSI